ncbi:MAG TPA: hypothetical protein PK187_01060, partial [Candidatus Syntrophosphaera thermopropionivorans]|nr:hypothetical protein [Candidatus Syntrophosphaera thermopropionivorans]
MSRLILGLVILEVAVLALLIIIICKKLEKMETAKEPHRHSRDDAQIQNLYTILNSHNTKLAKLEEMEERIKQLENRLEQLDQIKKPELENTVNPPIEILPPKAKEETNNDNKIWVWRSEEGLKKLEPVSNPKGLYLIKDGAKYLLYLDNLYKENINDTMRLYREIIDFPANIQIND